MKETRRFSRFHLFYVFFAIWAVATIHDLISYRTQVETVPYSQFLGYLAEKKIDKVSVLGARIEGTLKQAPAGHPARFSTVKMEDPTLTQRLSDAGAKFEAVQESTFGRDILSWIVPALKRGVSVPK